MAHRKWKEIKQQPSMLPGPDVPVCCLVYFHFMRAIYPIHPVELVEDCPRRQHVLCVRLHLYACVSGLYIALCVPWLINVDYLSSCGPTGGPVHKSRIEIELESLKLKFEMHKNFNKLFQLNFLCILIYCELR